jgi:SagB-type dehydrogenase family enzyme
LQFSDLEIARKIHAKARRTQRTFRRAPIKLQALANCLSVGLQITGFVEYPIFGRLPRKPTPSPGARNPFEAYVYCLRVDALERGFYHYSALEHSLGLLGSESLPEPHDLLGGQLWTDDAAAIVFLVADYDRMMWKYAHALSYRVVLIEAGHIAQNMLLAATSANLATAITAAVCDSLAEHTLGLTSITQSAMYAVLIGVPAATPRCTP